MLVSCGGGFLTGDSAPFTGFFELFVTGLVDFLVAAFQPVLGRDEADGRVQPGGVVILDEVAGDALGFLYVQRGQRTDGLILEGLVEPFEFAVGLRGNRDWS